VRDSGTDPWYSDLSLVWAGRRVYPYRPGLRDRPTPHFPPSNWNTATSSLTQASPKLPTNAARSSCYQVLNLRLCVHVVALLQMSNPQRRSERDAPPPLIHKKPTQNALRLDPRPRRTPMSTSLSSNATSNKGTTSHQI
jgi:hypothetical protein